MPCYNYGRFLGDNIRAILNQTIQDFEIIVIDDASTDETADVVAAFHDRRIRVIRHDLNRGLCYTLNEGYAEAKGEYIARIDADDRYRPCFLEEATTILRARPGVGIFYGDVALIDVNGEIREDPYTGIDSHDSHHGQDVEADEYLSQVVRYVMPAPTVAAHRDRWREVLPIPDWFSYEGPSDWYLSLRISRLHPVYYRSRTLADYRVHGLNMHRDATADHRCEATIVRVLDELFAEPDHAEEKRRLRRGYYAHVYAEMGDRYFSTGLNREARGSYARALNYRPDYAFKSGIARRLAATIIGRRWYEAAKRLVVRPHIEAPPA